MEDDRKIHAALDQMREAFRMEENPNGAVKGGNYRSTSQLSQGRDKSREHSNSRLYNQAPPQNVNV